MAYRILKKGLKGIIWGPRNLILRATGEQLRPRWLWFEVTDRCNSRCKHCSIWRKEPTTDLLTPQELGEALRDPLFRDVEYIINSGGEPSLRSDLGDIIQIERETLPNARIQISTNGLLPDRILGVVASALTNGAAVDVGVSLDGIKEQHDAIRGVKGNFERVDYLLRELATLSDTYGKRLRPTIGFVLSSLTLPHLEDVRAYAREVSADLIIQWHRESTFFDNVGLSYNAESMLETVKTLPCRVSRDIWLDHLRGKSPRFACFALYTFCVLKCDGSISPCLDMWDVEVGTVRERSPSAIWHGAEAEATREAVTRCQGCLNGWGVEWSYASSFHPYVLFYLRHPRAFLKKLL